MWFDKWKFIFYSKLTQLCRLHKLLFDMTLGKCFPNIYEIRNAYLRNHIKSIKREFYILSDTSLFVWSTIMSLCFSVFFYKKINLKYVIYGLFSIIFFILICMVIFYVFIIKHYITYTNVITDILPIFSIFSNKCINNIFDHLIILGL